MPVALISTSTSPSRGPSSSTISRLKGFPAARATAAVEAQIKSGKPGRPYTLWRIEEFGGGSPCGAVSYTEDALPEEFRDNNFHCEWGKRAVERFVVERAGGSYKIVKREQVMTSGSTDFNPIGICVTPEGDGFYVADWNLGGWNNTEGAGSSFQAHLRRPNECEAKAGVVCAGVNGQRIQSRDEGTDRSAQASR